MAVLCSVLPGTISVNPSSNLGREPLGSASFYRIRGIKNSSNLHTVTQLLSSWLVPTWTSTAKPCPMKPQSRGLIPVLGADGVMSTGENRQAQREPTQPVMASGRTAGTHAHMHAHCSVPLAPVRPHIAQCHQECTMPSSLRHTLSPRESFVTPKPFEH